MFLTKLPIFPVNAHTHCIVFIEYMVSTKIHCIWWTIKLVSFFFKESNFQIVRVFCVSKIFFLIFDTFLKKKTDQLYGPPYIHIGQCCGSIFLKAPCPVCIYYRGEVLFMWPTGFFIAVLFFPGISRVR
jgi:hypothetical protein